MPLGRASTNNSSSNNQQQQPSSAASRVESSPKTSGVAGLVEPDSPPFIVVRVHEKRSKLESFQRACEEVDSEHERFEAMVNSMTGSLSNLEFLDRKNRERMSAASLMAVNEEIVASVGGGGSGGKKASASLTVSNLSANLQRSTVGGGGVVTRGEMGGGAGGGIGGGMSSSLQLGFNTSANSNVEISSLSYRPSFCDRHSVSGFVLCKSSFFFIII